MHYPKEITKQLQNFSVEKKLYYCFHEIITLLAKPTFLGPSGWYVKHLAGSPKRPWIEGVHNFW